MSGSTATVPGATPQTRTSGASARASTRVSIACAAFAAQWAANDGHGWYAATSSTMTTSPPLSRRCGAAACVTKKLPLTVAPSAASTSSSETSSNRFGSNPGRRSVDDDVQAPELRGRSLDERLRSVGAREVAVAASGGDHLPSLVPQALRNRGAELAGAAGDERPHVSTPVACPRLRSGGRPRPS